jgi:hypothetical protein
MRTQHAYAQIACISAHRVHMHTLHINVPQIHMVITLHTHAMHRKMRPVAGCPHCMHMDTLHTYGYIAFASTRIIYMHTLHTYGHTAYIHRVIALHMRPMHRKLYPIFGCSHCICMNMVHTHKPMSYGSVSD